MFLRDVLSEVLLTYAVFFPITIFNFDFLQCPFRRIYYEARLGQFCAILFIIFSSQSKGVQTKQHRICTNGCLSVFVCAVKNPTIIQLD